MGIPKQQRYKPLQRILKMNQDRFYREYDTGYSAAGNSKHCDISTAKADYKKYKWEFAGDNNDMDKVQGTVIHNREWEYSMLDYYTLVKVMVDFKAQCTFALRGASAARKLRVIDDDGNVHGEIQLNIHAGTPCVCAEASKIEVKKATKTIRGAEPYNTKLVGGECRTSRPVSPSSSDTEVGATGRARADDRFKATAALRMKEEVKKLEKEIEA